MDQKWHSRYLSMAYLVASWSKDPSTKCGSVIVDKRKRFVSLGFNGFPMGVSDEESIYENRSEKYKRVIHAEKNAILFANKDLTGCTLYVVPMPPCSICAGMIIQSGISRVVTVKPNSKEMVDRWLESYTTSLEMFNEVGIEVIYYDMCDEKYHSTINTVSL